jgi:hypothetical protein
MITFGGFCALISLPPHAESAVTVATLATHVNATRSRFTDVSFFIALCRAKEAHHRRNPDEIKSSCRMDNSRNQFAANGGTHARRMTRMAIE